MTQKFIQSLVLENYCEPPPPPHTHTKDAVIKNNFN